MTNYDYLVIGSGCAGAMTAQTLVEAGVEVAMLDVGVQDKTFETLIPDKDFLSIRKTDTDQYKYLIGANGEGISWGKVGKGAQVTPPRFYMTGLVDRYLPIESKNFSPLESLGYGGLGIGWGLQCWEYSDADLKLTGLNIKKVRNAYDLVSQRIGISATKDAAADYTVGNLKSFQPSADVDKNHAYIQKRYQKQKNSLIRKGVYVGRTPLALITQNYNGRKGYSYGDMDFYSNQGESAWRPQVTIDSLRKNANFKYLGSHLVTEFSENGSFVTVRGINTKSQQSFSIKSRKLILAAGALGSARIVLRSIGKESDKLPILSNPHSYIPCVQPALIGQDFEKHKLGLGQLSYFIDSNGQDKGISVASSYSYQSLMLFRLATQMPLGFNDARIITRYLMSGLVLVIAQHPDAPSANKYIKLVSDPKSPTRDKLEINFNLTENEKSNWNKREKQYASLMRKLKTYPLKRVPTENGASIHYAGTIPFSKTASRLRLNPNGRLHGTKQVFIADSSGFNYLPAKGLTFTLMANAHVTAENALKNS